MWDHRYRPRSIEDLIVADPEAARLMRRWVQAGEFPHLLLHGPPGTGKTTAATLLAASTGGDTLTINASLERGIDTVRDRIYSFATRLGDDGLRVVILDEADQLSEAAQASLRGLFDTVADTCRFVMTANWPGRIVEPLRSRSVILEFTPLPRTSLIAFAKRILEKEGVDCDEETVAAHVRASAGDVRALLLSLERASSSGRLSPPPDTDSTFAKVLMVALSGSQIDLARLLSCHDVDSLRRLYAWLADEIPRRFDGDLQLRAMIELGRAAADHEITALPRVVAQGFFAKLRILVDRARGTGGRRKEVISEERVDKPKSSRARRKSS